MPFGMVSEVSRGMGVLDGVVIVKGNGQFWGEFGASHCKQWGLCDTLFSSYFHDLLLFVLCSVMCFVAWFGVLVEAV